MAKRNIWTEVVQEERDFIKQLREDADKSDAVGFMEERVRPRDAARRFAAMTESERMEWIQRHGIEEALRLARALKGAGHAGR